MLTSHRNRSPTLTKLRPETRLLLDLLVTGDMSGRHHDGLHYRCWAWLKRRVRQSAGRHGEPTAHDPIDQERIIMLPQWTARPLESLQQATMNHEGPPHSDNNNGLCSSQRRMMSEVPLPSRFLTRLPTEIRLLVYKYVFSSHTTPVFFHKISARLNPAYPPQYISNDSHVWSCYHFLDHLDMSLLRTCRQIYREGLATAVNSSLFYLNGPFSQFNNCWNPLPPQPLGSISHLAVQWVYCATGQDAVTGHYYVETERATWENIWATVAAIKHLKSLAIFLVYAGPRNKMHAEASWLLPLRQIQGVKSLKIDIRYFRSQWQAENPLNEALYKMMIANDRAPYVNIMPEGRRPWELDW